MYLCAPGLVSVWIPCYPYPDLKYMISERVTRPPDISNLCIRPLVPDFVTLQKVTIHSSTLDSTNQTGASRAVSLSVQAFFASSSRTSIYPMSTSAFERTATTRFHSQKEVVSTKGSNAKSVEFVDVVSFVYASIFPVLAQTE